MKENILRYGPSVSIIIFGLILLIGGFTGAQNSYFLMASGAIVLAGIFATLNAAGIITNKSAKGVSAVLVIVALVIAYFNYKSIEEPIEFMKKKNYRYSAVIQRLKDIREAEIAYKKEYGKYTGSFDTLIDFIKNDSVKVIKMFGDVPDTLTEMEALELGIVRRDTIRVPAYEYIFNENYMAKRDPRWELNVDELRYVPFTDNSEFDIAAGVLERSSGVKVQVFQVTDSDPFDPQDVLQVGSLENPTVSGNWKEEK